MFKTYVLPALFGVLALAILCGVSVGAIGLYQLVSPRTAEIKETWGELVAEASTATTSMEEAPKEASGQTEETLPPAASYEEPRAISGGSVLGQMTDELSQGGWEVTFYEGATDQMHGWFESLKDPDPANWPDYPNVDNPRVDFVAANGLEYGLDERNYCPNDICDVLVPARGYNLMTADYDLEFASCYAKDGVGCGIVVFNVGDVTANFEDVMVDNGFSVDGRYWNGDELHQAIWGVVSHMSANMLNYATNGTGGDTMNDPDRTNAGANCSVPQGCAGVLWRVVVTSGNQVLAIAETTVR